MDSRLFHLLAAAAVALGFMPPEFASTARAADAPQEPDEPVREDAGVSRVVNGNVTSDWPATAALMEQGEAFCTGTLIRENVVLTAAHCLEFGAPAAVYFGDQPGVGGENVAVSFSIMHPSYAASDTGDAYFDIGLVFLDGTASPEPLPVANIPGDALLGASILYVGFGASQGTGGEGFKKEATARVTELEADVLVVQPDNGSACYGDSGGPVLHLTAGGTAEVVGVVSFGYTDDCMDLGGNTRTDMYVDWIAAEADGAVPPPGGDDDDGWTNGGDDDGGSAGGADADDWNDPADGWSDDESGDDCSFTDANGTVWNSEDCEASADGGRACSMGASSPSVSLLSLLFLLPLGLAVRRVRS